MSTVNQLRYVLEHYELWLIVSVCEEKENTWGDFDVPFRNPNCRFHTNIPLYLKVYVLHDRTSLRLRDVFTYFICGYNWNWFELCILFSYFLWKEDKQLPFIPFSSRLFRILILTFRSIQGGDFTNGNVNPLTFFQPFISLEERAFHF